MQGSKDYPFIAGKGTTRHPELINRINRKSMVPAKLFIKSLKTFMMDVNYNSI
jgi:hypothetical protein